MIAQIDNYAIKCIKRWDLMGNGEKQIEKLKRIINSELKTFYCNNSNYGIYDVHDVTYGGHEGKQFTLDVEELQQSTVRYLSEWWVPTVEGVIVDLWLIE